MKIVVAFICDSWQFTAVKEKKQSKSTVYLGFRISADEAARLAAKAAASKRSKAGELRVALETHLKN